MTATIVGVLGPDGLSVFDDKEAALVFLSEHESPDAKELAGWIKDGKCHLPARNKNWRIAYGEAEFCF